MNVFAWFVTHKLMECSQVQGASLIFSGRGDENGDRVFLPEYRIIENGWNLVISIKIHKTSAKNQRFFCIFHDVVAEYKELIPYKVQVCTTKSDSTAVIDS